MTNNLVNNLQNIKKNKDMNLKPENLKAGVNCLGVTGILKQGIDTSDANATPDDITQGKTAYVNGEKITGIVETLQRIFGNYIESINYVPNFSNIVSITASTDMSTPVILKPSEDTNKLMMNINISDTELASHLQISSNKIKKGENILGIAGTADTIDNYISVPTEGSLEIKNLFTSFPLIDTSNVTNMSSMFSGCTNLTSIPELDTSNVTDMGEMFFDCSSLTTIPELDTSNVTNMSSMFSGCTNLTTIPKLNTSNATNMSIMFFGCTNLTTIPELDTSNATSISNMFNGCTNLTTIPELDTSNVTNMASMFFGCTNLTTIPELNTSNVTNMSIMFNGCSSLSNETLNNILQMLINATSYTRTKTLKYIGLSEEQATTCTTLSNWAACETAGWTTGY